ncbi:GNAT family N-acetyltransferase [Longispora albida]|uniref:GNAT family N-acetyltransferase n=1 Tax=Longispora albida TaxID=203523 RepID=UPI00058DE6B4|nr:GNAT family N-acetyltransferase [Longispora albida]
MRIERAGNAGLTKDLVASIVELYTDVFSRPPWNDPVEFCAVYGERLLDDAQREGFRLVLGWSDGGRLDALGVGWTTPDPFPGDRSYGRVASTLGPEGVAELLAGAFVVDELAVRPSAQGHGAGRRILAALTEDLPDGRAWLLTNEVAAGAVAFYRRQGWTEHASPERPGLVVFTTSTA